jgi:hypothetical protein
MAVTVKFADKAKWYCVVSAIIFISISSYLRVKFVFDSGRTAGILFLAALLFALLTFVFALFSFPRWQSFVAFLVFAYAVYWALFTPGYAIS